MVPPKELKLTQHDDEIFAHTMEKFPELAEPPHEKLTKLDEEWLKSADGKKKWRDFILQYENKIKDYNFGSLIRTDAREEYGESNTIFGVCTRPTMALYLSSISDTDTGAR
ncbi:hypothetical protein AX14_004729 [Amanita brunnescens Koide BX004]|nr:hypothetical protein AX14_004729 [Amanita brunnescens Koide BX004]